MVGVCVLPVGMLPENRNSAGAIRPIGLNPPGVCTNEVLSAFMDDITEGTMTVFESVDANGEEIVIFLEVLWYVGDYPTVSHKLDMLGYSSNLPSYLCTYTRYNRSGAEQSKYRYTYHIHSDHSSFARSEERSMALREADLSTAKLQSLRIYDGDTFETNLQVLHQVVSKLVAVRGRVPRIIGGNVPVVPVTSDSYRSCMMAPDRFFLELERDIMNVCVTFFPPGVPQDVEVLAKEAFWENDLI